jgi:hypothetical protein
MRVNLEHFSSVKDFVSVSQNCTAEILLCSGNYRIDGKSILGIFSLDLSKPVDLVCEDENDYPKFSKWFTMEKVE